MGKTVHLGGQEESDGEGEQVPEDMTIAELKRRLDVPEHDAVGYRDENGEMMLSDRDEVRHIPDGASLFTTPKGGMLAG
ncbi:MAG: hypothetical protein SV186_04880 [Candidatus Nanohaloarchaea archaeon]|nr:hypothetical protein [Candidatus Nanohaloarchaea archaeon]